MVDAVFQEEIYEHYHHLIIKKTNKEVKKRRIVPSPLLSSLPPPCSLHCKGRVRFAFLSLGLFAASCRCRLFPPALLK